MEEEKTSVKKINSISNPLTMVGIFAGLAETAGVVILPFLAEAYQKYFMWYVMGFPVLIVCLFFYVLVRHPENLYAPSDYRDEENYVRIKQQLNTAVALTAASLTQNQNANTKKSPMEIEAIPDIVFKASSNINVRKTSRWKNQILWVDDNPENNLYAQEAFENVGFEVSIALSTKQALDLMKNKKFAAIISDMGRKEGPREGYVLLEHIRRQGITTPFIIYAGSSLPEHVEEAMARGAQGSTGNAQELFSLVMREIDKP